MLHRIDVTATSVYSGYFIVAFDAQRKGVEPGQPVWLPSLSNCRAALPLRFVGFACEIWPLASMTRLVKLAFQELEPANTRAACRIRVLADAGIWMYVFHGIPVLYCQVLSNPAQIPLLSLSCGP